MSVGFVKREQLLLCISYLSRLWRFCQKVLRPVMPHLRIKVNSSSVSALKVKGRVTLKPPSKGKGLHKGLAGSEKESQGLPLQLQLAFKEGEGKKRKFLRKTSIFVVIQINSIPREPEMPGLKGTHLYR